MPLKADDEPIADSRPTPRAYRILGFLARMQGETKRWPARASRIAKIRSFAMWDLINKPAAPVESAALTKSGSSCTVRKTILASECSPNQILGCVESIHDGHGNVHQNDIRT